MRRVFCAATLAACLVNAAHSEEPAFAQRPETQPPSIGALSDMMISILPRPAI